MVGGGDRRPLLCLWKFSLSKLQWQGTAPCRSQCILGVITRGSRSSQGFHGTVFSFHREAQVHSIWRPYRKVDAVAVALLPTPSGEENVGLWKELEQESVGLGLGFRQLSDSLCVVFLKSSMGRILICFLCSFYFLFGVTYKKLYILNLYHLMNLEISLETIITIHYINISITFFPPPLFILLLSLLFCDMNMNFEHQ